LNGAEPLVRTLLASGVNTCFANPGTSEMHFVAVHDRVPGMRKAAPALARALPFASNVLQPLDHVRADGGRKTVKHSNPQIRRHAVAALDPPRTASPSGDQTSAMIIRTNSHSRLPLQASVRTSPNPIMAGGHTPAIAPLIETAFAASANSDFRVCSNVAVMVTPYHAGNVACSSARAAPPLLHCYQGGPQQERPRMRHHLRGFSFTIAQIQQSIAQQHYEHCACCNAI
jgi:hypothetical protein